MSEHIVKLKHPVQFGSETISVLEFKKLKAKHLRKLPLQPSMDDMLKLAGTLCDQPDAVIDELSGEDVAVVVELVGGFFGDFGGTGAK